MAFTQFVTSASHTDQRHLRASRFLLLSSPQKRVRLKEKLKMIQSRNKESSPVTGVASLASLLSCTSPLQHHMQTVRFLLTLFLHLRWEQTHIDWLNQNLPGCSACLQRYTVTTLRSSESVVY